MMVDKQIIELTIVIPCFFSGKNLSELLANLRKSMTDIGKSYEIILVNDGSSDDTWSQILKMTSIYPHLRGFNLMRNFGQHNALLVGILNSRGRYIFTMDDDQQHPSSEIRKLLTELEGGADVVYGIPLREKHSVIRNLSSMVAKKMIGWAFSFPNASETSAFRGLRAEVVNAFRSFNGPYVDIDALLLWGTNNIKSIETTREKRKHYSSNYTFCKLVIHSINMITAFSGRPLRIASIVGFVATLMGILSFCYILINFYIHGHAVPGFAFLGSIISLLAGAQLFSIGVMGEYMIHIHFRAMGHPCAVIREEVSSLVSEST